MGKMICTVCFTLVFTLASITSSAQSKYPERPVQAIVAYTAGGSTDAAARVAAELFKKHLGQPVVVVNKGGGGGAIGGNELSKAKPDGYTIGMFNENQPLPELQMNPGRYIYKNEDIVPVAQLASYVPGIFTKYEAPWSSLKELVDHAKKDPNKIKWGYPGRGGLMWIIGHLLAQRADIKILEVPFDNDSLSIAGILGNHIDFSVSIFSPAPIAQVEAKKIRPLCLVTPKRVDLFPTVPTAGELGYDLGIPDVYFGIFVPKDTPKDVIARLSAASKGVAADPEFKEKMNKIGFRVFFQDSKPFGELVQSYGKVKWDALKKLGALQ